MPIWQLLQCHWSKKKGSKVKVLRYKPFFGAEGFNIATAAASRSICLKQSLIRLPTNLRLAKLRGFLLVCSQPRAFGFCRAVDGN